MTHKTLLLSTLSAILLSVNTNAQDKLHKMNGETINVKVTDVNTREISYKRADNPDGPTYSISKREVESVTYQNGTEDVFNRVVHREGKKAEKVKYGKNILALAPVQIFDGDGFGIGLSYERVLDKKGILSFYLPVAVSFNTNDYYNSPTPLTSSYAPSGSSIQYTSYAAFPGLKIYPTGSKGKVRYSVGPSIAIIAGQTVTNGYLGYTTQPGYYGPVYGEYVADKFTLGMMVNNTLNIQPTAHLYLGLELGLGMSYINTVDNIAVGQTGLAQFSFRMGYRF